MRPIQNTVKQAFILISKKAVLEISNVIISHKKNQKMKTGENKKSSFRKFIKSV